MLGFRQITRPGSATYFAIGQPGSPVTIDIWFERVSRWARTLARLPGGSHA